MTPLDEFVKVNPSATVQISYDVDDGWWTVSISEDTFDVTKQAETFERAFGICIKVWEARNRG